VFFSGPNSNIAGNTLNNTTFLQINGNYVTFANHALYVPGLPTVIDAQNVSWDGYVVGNYLPSLARNALIAAIEARITDFDDRGAGPRFADPSFVGQIFVGGIFIPGVGVTDAFDRIVVDGPFAFSADPFGRNQAIGGGGGGGGTSLQALQNIAPAAGGDTPQDLNAINPAAGPGGATQCAATAGEELANDLLGNFSFGAVTQFSDSVQQCAERVEQQRASVQ
jgi:hypothetical protein